MTGTVLEEGGMSTDRDLVFVVLAVGLGLGVGWLDVRTTEVTVTVVALLAVGFLLGLLGPGKPWRWALLIALGLPVMAGVAELTGMQTAEPARVDPRVALVALGFALVGCYAGAVIRRAAGAAAG